MEIIYAIKTPNGTLAWFGHSQHDAWNTFFNHNPHRLPIAEAIEAYKAIGYSCVKLEIKEAQ